MNLSLSDAPAKPPTRTRKKPKVKEEESEPELEAELPTFSDYIEIGAQDLKQPEPEIAEITISHPASSELSDSEASNFGPVLSRKTRLQIRKCHLLAELVSLRFFFKHSILDLELIAVALSIIPSHILRIFDRRMLEDAKSLKNCIAMLATWWKGNVGLRMLPGDLNRKRPDLRNQRRAFKLALTSKSMYEDDSVKVSNQ